jgi:hypothetical protein
MFYCPKTNGWFKKEYIILLAEETWVPGEISDLPQFTDQVFYPQISLFYI